MGNYRRIKASGGTYFFTQVTYQRNPWLCQEIARSLLRSAITQVRQKYPFQIDAIVLLPDHLHCIWTLPDNDNDYATRWRLIKGYVTKNGASRLKIDTESTESRKKRKEGTLWQRRFWEHLIQDETDFEQHLHYIHYNPVKHGLCSRAADWQYSSFHRYVSADVYPTTWGVQGAYSFAIAGED